MRHLAALALTLGLALPAAALDLENMTDEQREIFREEVRAYLMDNPQVIMDAVAVLEQRQQEQQAKADLTLVSDNKDELFDDGYSWVGGNPEGDITLVEFLDYRCGYCRRAHDEVAKLLETDGNIRLIVKEFPILGEQSILASRFAIATRHAAGDDAYKDLHDALMTYSGEINIQNLKRLGDSLALDVDAIEAQMSSEKVTEEITKTRALAQRMQIQGTPTFVMEDELLRGYLPYDQMLQVLRDKRS